MSVDRAKACGKWTGNDTASPVAIALLKLRFSFSRKAGHRRAERVSEPCRTADWRPVV